MPYESDTLNPRPLTATARRDNSFLAGPSFVVRSLYSLLRKNAYLFVLRPVRITGMTHGTPFNSRFIVY